MTNILTRAMNVAMWILFYFQDGEMRKQMNDDRQIPYQRSHVVKQIPKHMLGPTLSCIILSISCYLGITHASWESIAITSMIVLLFLILEYRNFRDESAPPSTDQSRNMYHVAALVLWFLAVVVEQSLSFYSCFYDEVIWWCIVLPIFYSIFMPWYSSRLQPHTLAAVCKLGWCYVLENLLSPYSCILFTSTPIPFRFQWRASWWSSVWCLPTLMLRYAATVYFSVQVVHFACHLWSKAADKFLHLYLYQKRRFMALLYVIWHSMFMYNNQLQFVTT
jgi:hypothetical protein